MSNKDFLEILNEQGGDFDEKVKRVLQYNRGKAFNAAERTIAASAAKMVRRLETSFSDIKSAREEIQERLDNEAGTPLVFMRGSGVSDTSVLGSTTARYERACGQYDMALLAFNDTYTIGKAAGLWE